jgi:predicted dehydrogenase
MDISRRKAEYARRTPSEPWEPPTAMSILRIGISGAGLISQVEHIPNLLHLPNLFEVVAVADPSARARAFVAERWGLATHESLDGLLGERLDALLVASPDFAHRDTVLSGLAAGLHVLCEKPLCYDVADVDRLIAARDAAGRVLQVGYMKRFDPSVEAALAALPATGDGLRYIAVEVNEAETAVQLEEIRLALGLANLLAALELAIAAAHGVIVKK